MVQTMRRATRVVASTLTLALAMALWLGPRLAGQVPPYTYQDILNTNGVPPRPTMPVGISDWSGMIPPSHLGALGLPPGSGEDHAGITPSAGRGVSVTSVSPAKHHIDGGLRVTIRGDGFYSGVEALVNGQLLTELIYYHPTRIAGRVPANPAGVYDLVLRDAETQEVLATLPSAVEYVVGKLPGPEDATAVRLDDNTVKLTWSNLVRYESMVVQRDGQPVQTLSGYPTEYVDGGAAYVPGQAIQYDVIGIAGADVSEEATFFNLVIDPDCLEFVGKGASGRWDGRRYIRLYREVQICFTLVTDVNGLGITVLATRVASGGELKARIRDASDPDTILWDGLPFDDIHIGDGLVYRDTVAGALLAGEYVLGIYVDPDFTGQPFSLARDGSEENGTCYCLAAGRAGAADESRAVCIAWHPLPRYPVVFFQPYCGNVPPTVTSIVRDVSALRPGDPEDEEVFLEDLDGPHVPEEPALGFAPLEPAVLMVRANAVDVDGVIERYIWHFGGAGTLRSSSGANATFVYDEPGCYTVTVTVVDDEGSFDSGFQDFCPADAYCSFPPDEGSPPAIGNISTDPERLVTPTFIGGIDASPTQAYYVPICAAVDSLIPDDGVTMQFRHPESGAPLGPQIDATRLADQPETFKALMDFSDPDLLGLNEVVLRITATDDALQQASADFILHLCPVPPFYYSPHVDTVISYDARSMAYEAQTTIPSPGLDTIALDEWQFDLPYVGGGLLDNSISARINHTMDLRNGSWFAEDLEGSLDLIFLDSAYGPFAFPRQDPADPGPHGCEDYEISYGAERGAEAERGLCPGEIEVANFATTINVTAQLNWRILGIRIRATVSRAIPVTVSIRLCPATFTLTFNLAAGSFTATIGGRVLVTADEQLDINIPDPDLLTDVIVRFFATVQVEIPFTVTVTGTLIPPTFNPPTITTAGNCFEFDLDADICGCEAVFGGCICSADVNLWNEDFGSSCPLRGSERGLLPVPPPLQQPSIAVAPDGSTAMLVYIRNLATGAGGYDPELYFAVDGGTGFSSPAPVSSPASPFSQRHPDLAYLSQSQVLAVWTQGRLTAAQEEALPDTPESVNEALKNSDIFYALYDVPSGTWADPVVLSSNGPALFPDGRPVAAALPDVVAPGAWIAWVRSETEDMVSSNGFMLSGTSIYAHQIQAGLPVGMLEKISVGDETNPAADVQPALAVSPSGNIALLIWVRDQDSDFDTSDDRFLMYAVNVGGGWSAPQPITDPVSLPGVMNPSVALSSDDDGMVAFTVRDVDTSGIPFGAGDRDLIYTVEIKDAAFQPPVALQRHVSVQGGRVYGQKPIVRYLDSANAAVVFRDFDRSVGGQGELAVATIDLAQLEPQWSLVRDITDDGVRDWETDAAVDPTGRIRTVRGVSTNGLPEFDGLAFEDIDTLATDIAIDRIHVSNPYTPAGQLVELTAVLRNNGLRTAQTMTNGFMHVGEVIDDVFQEIDVIPFDLVVPPDQTQTMVYTMWMLVRSSRMRFVVELIQPEMDMTNNVADVVLGVLPPLNLQCSDAAAAAGTLPDVSLTWENGETYESVLVYRNGRLRAELDGHAESYLDVTVGPGVHEWSVRGQIGRAISDPDAAACEHIVVPPGDFDGDGDVDLDDYAVFVDCMEGPGVTPDPTGSITPQDCLGAFDFDGDGDVDLEDWAGFQAVFTGGT